MTESGTNVHADNKSCFIMRNATTFILPNKRYFSSGTYQAAGVIQAAYELNEPLVYMTPECGDISGDLDISYFSVDSPAVILETVKKVTASMLKLILFNSVWIVFEILARFGLSSRRLGHVMFSFRLTALMT